PQQKIGTLSDLGLTGLNLTMVKEALKRPYGLIFLVGPTGSGKTTTLYSMLQLLNQERFYIVSLEDPIEYNIEGVNQSQVKPEIGYTFANGLRSILRQDPDTIMVGEVRDKETAQLAVHAALTGHLVLSTLHTNSAVGAVPRLIDMGVDPYLIAPTLIMTVGQRLARTLCQDSKKELEVKDNLKTRLERELANVPSSIKEKIKMPAKIYQAMPSPTCPKGTRGRIGVFEVLLMNKEIENILLTNPVEEAILKAGRKEGMITMREDGVLKVLGGQVGLEELEEVI
ncbi:MAG: ATPase, T2SS/T4P/T4SS family, partial [Patescibacteria group bacterium]